MTCPACGAPYDQGSEWCERCLRRFDYVPAAATNIEESKTAFVRTGSTNLTRLAARGPLVFVEPGGDVQATVMEQRVEPGNGQLVDAFLTGDSTRHLGMRYSVTDETDVPVFYVERYRAATEASFGVYEPDGDALAVYLAGDPFVVRDGTGAPVARLQRRKDRMELVEVGGGAIAQCWKSPLDLGWMVDEQWGLTVLEEPVVMDRRALVAWPLVSRLLWSPPPRRKQDHDGSLIGAAGGFGLDAGPLLGDLVGGFFLSLF